MSSDQWLPNGPDLPASHAAPPPETHPDWLPPEAADTPRATDAEPASPPALATLIREGDADALLGFRDAHEPSVRAYMRALCPGDRVQEAVDSCFTDLVGRLTPDAGETVDLEALVLMSARSVAAGRFEVANEAGPNVDPICRSVPELLAARANGELDSAEALERHLESCAICSASAARMEEAERRFREAGLGAPEGRAPHAQAQAPEAPQPPPPAPEPPEPPEPPPPPQTVVRRTGGLVGGLRKTLGGVTERSRRGGS